MKIVCLVKQVPHFSAIEFDPETKSLKREGVPVELNVFCRYAVQHAVALREQGRRRGDRDDDGPAAGRGGTTRVPRARSRPGNPPLGSRLRAGRHARHLAHPGDGAGEGRRRPRPVRAQVPRLRDLAGAARGGSLPRLAAHDQRGGAGRLRRTAAALPRDGLRVRDLRGRAAARRVRRTRSRDAGVRPQGV